MIAHGSFNPVAPMALRFTRSGETVSGGWATRPQTDQLIVGWRDDTPLILFEGELISLDEPDQFEDDGVITESWWATAHGISVSLVAVHPSDVAGLMERNPPSKLAGLIEWRSIERPNRQEAAA
jgi:hypothetical protein